jgi:putative phosphonate metabolism protein
MSARYAVYFSPPQHSPWWELGARWLGRDECDDVALAQPLLAEIEPTEFHSITAQPRRYGFHATLKAPFRLSLGHSVEELMARLQALARQLQPVTLGPVQAAVLGHFVALVPSTQADGVNALAAACVTQLDELREPLSPADLARRNVEKLDQRERELLQSYGYPYALERFRLHFSMSGPVSTSMAQRAIGALVDPVARLNVTAPLTLDRLCLFVEPAPDQPFCRIADLELHP